MEKIVISLFIICLLFHFSKSNLIVVNLDSGEETNDKNLISNYLKDDSNNLSISYRQYKYSSSISETINVGEKQNIEMRLGDEAFNSVIDTVMFYTKKAYLSTFIKTNIDSSIIPQNFYEASSNISERHYDMGKEYPSNVTDYEITCEYNNKIPTFKYHTFSINYTSIVATANFNFGLDSNNLLKIFTFDKSQKINEFDLSFFNINDEEEGNGIAFSKLILADPVFTNDQMLFAILNDSIYIYLISDTISSSIKMTFLTKLNIQSNEIIQASYNENYYFILTDNGLEYYNRGNSSYVDIKQGIYKDFLVNNRSIYIMSQNGFEIYDTSNMSNFGNSPAFIFEHKYLSKFDYVLYDNTNRNSSYFIGIIVDNRPEEGVNEILIELVANGQYELSPRYNHVFVTQTAISVDNIVTDKYSYFTYILDNNKMYLLTRSVPVFQIGYSYLLDVSANNPQSISIIARNDYVEGIENEANYFRDLLIYEGSDKKLLSSLNRTNPNLICSVKNSGIIYEYLVFRDDCSGYNDKSEWEIRECLRNLYYIFDVETTADKIKRIGIWVGVILGIIIILFIVFYVFCCIFKKRKGVVISSENINSTNENQKKNEIDEKP